MIRHWREVRCCVLGVLAFGTQHAIGHPHDALEACLAVEKPIERLQCLEQGLHEVSRSSVRSPASIEHTEAIYEKTTESYRGDSAELGSPPAPLLTPKDHARIAREKAPEKGARSVRIARVTGNARDAKVFYFDSGEAWRQTRHRLLDLPEAPFDASLEAGSFGSLRLRVGNSPCDIGEAD